MSGSCVIVNIGELVSLAPLTAGGAMRMPLHEADLGLIANAWLLIEEGVVQAFGPMPLPAALRTRTPPLPVVDAGGALCLPGLVDSHTHPLFAGERFAEFSARLAGKTYQEIARAGGGIQSSLRATRQARDEQLLDGAEQVLDRFLRQGVTTCEVKTGYGLSPAEELRGVRLLGHLKQARRQCVRITCLALHAVAPEYGSAQEQSAIMQRELLPQLAREKQADYVDAFIEQGYFSPESCDEFMSVAKALGFGIRIHADEFSSAGGAEAAARWGALSADHLQCASEEGLRALASAKVVATILPGTSLYAGLPFVDASRLVKAGCRVAIASDFNPGSCYIANLPLIASLAGVHGKLRPWEIIAGITLMPAYSLGLAHRKGALAVGWDGDFLLHPCKTLAAYLALMGQELPTSVWIRGALVHTSPV